MISGTLVDRLLRVIIIFAVDVKQLYEVQLLTVHLLGQFLTI